MKRLLLTLVVGGIVAAGIIAILRGPAKTFTANLFQKEAPTETVSQLSFGEDRDRDGLSDAKEVIYGTNPTIKDSDGDSYSDGDEVGNGYDPTTPGSAKVTESEALKDNLTVRYFEWARVVAKAEDPQLNDDAVRQFLTAEGLTQARMPTIADSEFSVQDRGGAEALQTYFTAFAAVRLPDVTSSYLDLASEVVRQKRSDILDDVIVGLQETYAAVQKIPVPPEAREIHRGQLATLKALGNLFADLYAIDRDPVLLLRDAAWIDDIILYSVALEGKRKEIAGQPAPKP